MENFKENTSEAIAEKLKMLIERDEHSKSLTVSQMALRDLENGNVHSAVSRLRVDQDKFIITNPDLYYYIEELWLKQEELWFNQRH